MSNLDKFTFSDTPGAKVVSAYLEGQHTKDFSNGHKIFAEDALFNGLLYKVRGGEVITQLFQGFADTQLQSIRIEAITEISADKFIVLFWTLLTGDKEEMIICDVITTRDGRICRIDNCFDVGKVSQQIKDEAAKVSNV